MNADRELLELAAKAAGIGLWWDFVDGSDVCSKDGGGEWNPRADVREALLIAAKLKLTIDIGDDVRVMSEDYDSRTGNYCAVESIGGHPLDAICRAIVRVAAAIGEAMP